MSVLIECGECKVKGCFWPQACRAEDEQKLIDNLPAGPSREAGQNHLDISRRKGALSECTARLAGIQPSSYTGSDVPEAAD